MPASTPKNLITRAELAQRAGVSRSAVTKACKAKLAPACVDDRLDADHPVVVQYLAGKAPKAPARKPATKKKPPAKGKPTKRRAKDAALDGTDPAKHAELDRIEPYASMTLRQLVEQFGSRRAFKDWLEALKKIEDIRKTRLDNDETEGTLIERELVKVHVFGAIESGNRKLLMDLPKTAARRLYAAAKSDTPVEEAERILRDLISSQLKPVRARSARVLRDA